MTQILGPDDDVEEDLIQDVMIYDSNDGDFTDDVLVGLRFETCVPAGVTILDAYLTFVADEADNAPTDVEIWAELATDPAPWSDLLPISARQPTVANQQWLDLDPWTVGFIDTTPDLTEIVAELVAQPNWAGCNSYMHFILSGSGDREEVHFDNDPTKAPKLTILYQP